MVREGRTMVDCLRNRPSNAWYAVLCHENAYKNDMKDTNKKLSQELRRAGGILVRKRNSIMFREWWLETEDSNSQYVLILGWREAKPCISLLEKALGRDELHKMPQAICMVAETSTALRHATSWASDQHCLNIPTTVVQDLSPDRMKAWLSSVVSNALGDAQRGPQGIVGPESGALNQELVNCPVEPRIPNVGAMQRGIVQATQDRHAVRDDHLVVADHSSAQIQFSFLPLVYANLFEAVRDPLAALWLNTLLMENMPEVYVD
eukprot:TRINITY_DN17665_c0_g1_i1.p1 TRINITY_DN17665_c0_g1~~TRINITY_DN17665_c0_g1_i1.p1  ORF type:complete len:263 (+),score=35.61 TRINITY_DN17665_c0_g1_i1:47-835(+)